MRIFIHHKMVAMKNEKMEWRLHTGRTADYTELAAKERAYIRHSSNSATTRSSTVAERPCDASGH